MIPSMVVMTPCGAMMAVISFNIKNQGTVYGGTGNDTITVTNSNAQLDSWLEGGFGNDKIVAGSGDDTLFSGYGRGYAGRWSW